MTESYATLPVDLLLCCGRRVSAAAAPRDTAMHNITASALDGKSEVDFVFENRSATLAARLADLQQRSLASDRAAAATLQQLLVQGREVADAMAAAADAMDGI